MPKTIALLIYPDVAELDFIGPKDVFYASKWLRQSSEQIITVAEDLNPVTCFGGTRVLPDADFETCGPVDILVVPGTADPMAQADNRPLLDWIAKVSTDCSWVTSVCTGSALLLSAGVGMGKKVTSHPQAIDALRNLNAATVLDNVRYVHDGNLVTSAGVSAGIDMSFWLLGQLHGVEHARAVQGVLDYYPEPPYAQPL